MYRLSCRVPTQKRDRSQSGGDEESHNASIDANTRRKSTLRRLLNPRISANHLPLQLACIRASSFARRSALALDQLRSHPSDRTQGPIWPDIADSFAQPQLLTNSRHASPPPGASDLVSNVVHVPHSSRHPRRLFPSDCGMDQGIFLGTALRQGSRRRRMAARNYTRRRLYFPLSQRSSPTSKNGAQGSSLHLCSLNRCMRASDMHVCLSSGDTRSSTCRSGAREADRSYTGPKRRKEKIGQRRLGKPEGSHLFTSWHHPEERFAGARQERDINQRLGHGKACGSFL